VSEARFDGVAALEQLSVFGAEASGLAPVGNGQAGVVGIDAAVTQIHHDLGRFARAILHQDAGLFDS
jgi:hypothetical protein